MSRPLVWWEGPCAPNLGGPGGYLGKLRLGLEAIGRPDAARFLGAADVEAPPSAGVRLRQALRKRCVSLAFPKARRKRLRAEAKLACKLDRSRKGLDALDFGAVICHETLSVPFFDRYLSGRGGAIPLGLMSHAPQLPSEEVYDDLLVNGNGPAAAERAQARMREIERAAFSRADFYVFPSREAMEPYAALAPLMAGKPIHFMASGCERVTTALSREAAKRKLGVATPLAIAYIGRHNAIKGYDRFQAAAKALLDEREDVTVLVAGKPSPSLPPPVHGRWIELGWADPAEVFRAADVFCLPNRQTYYDLVLLEALSSGSFVVASATGGNKSVFHETGGAITLYDGEAGLLPALRQALDLPEAAREAQRAQALAAWEANYTLEAFARRFVALTETFRGARP